MPGVDALLQLGGPFALIAALIIAFKYGMDAWNAWRQSRPTKVPQINDAVATNALLLESLKGERMRSDAKDKRIDELELEVSELRTQMYKQRDDYEHELLELRRQVDAMTNKLEYLLRKEQS